jgi:molecular chaperone HscC
MIGIDLGTTNAAIAVWHDGRPRLIPNSLGQVLTPSAVSIDEDGRLLVGIVGTRAGDRDRAISSRNSR